MAVIEFFFVFLYVCWYLDEFSNLPALIGRVANWSKMDEQGLFVSDSILFK